ncbi:exo-alpha-sialidase [Parapedobacter deserti]|uniref:exo-alpha-sialidase n=2 Tax=Parapedobacter deserti TaxID=1912957 RepID=A0ABV7JFF4_9SPHI
MPQKRDISAPILQKQVLWENGENGIAAYFVYGLLVTEKGNVLVASEGRIHDGTDDGAHHIVVRRSTDMAKSFSDSEIVVESVAGQSWANPTLMQDRNTGAVFLFYALNSNNSHSRVFFIRSDDDGASWLPPTEVTELFADNPHGWTFHLPGPGHGIQTTGGRLLVPIWHRKRISHAPLARAYGVNCIFSDDGGITWKVGGDTPVGELNESQLVEREDGSLLLIGRTYSMENSSWQAKVYSTDGGETWSSELEYDHGLTGRVCDIGLIRKSFQPNVILVSQPSDVKRRAELIIRMSADDGRSWPIQRILQTGPSTYSDLAVLPDGTVLCLYGHGQGDLKNMPAAVSLARFNTAWLTEESKAH